MDDIFSVFDYTFDDCIKIIDTTTSILKINVQRHYFEDWKDIWKLY